MATKEKIRQVIIEMADRKNNVTLEEIEWVMNQLGSYSKVSVRENDHQRMYSFEGEQFGICTHNRGNKQIKSCYVKAFLAAMVETGWYEN